MSTSQIGVNEHDCAECDKEAIGTGAQSLVKKRERFADQIGGSYYFFCPG
jgi:hypothetical protein